MAAKFALVFEAFGVIFVQMFVHTFALHVVGGGHSRVSEHLPSPRV